MALKNQFSSRDINMGNEDTFSLIFDEKKVEFAIEHWWSHRESGTAFSFAGGTKRLSLSEFKAEHGHQFEELVTFLLELGFQAEES